MKAAIKKKKTNYPNKSTLWAYFMQAIEPRSQKLNEAFPEFHPMWVVKSQKLDATAEQFKFMRQHLMRVTQKQCAAFMRVKLWVIQAWEQGKQPVPFIAIELLRLVTESADFRLSNEHWQGWFITQDGHLVTPDRGNLSFTPADLSYIRETHQAKSIYEAENIRLRAEIAPLKAEITELRELNGNDGLLLNELQQMESRLAEIAANFSSSKVVKLIPKTDHHSEKIKCA